MCFHSGITQSHKKMNVYLYVLIYVVIIENFNCSTSPGQPVVQNIILIKKLNHKLDFL